MVVKGTLVLSDGGGRLGECSDLADDTREGAFDGREGGGQSRFDLGNSQVGGVLDGVMDSLAKRGDDRDGFFNDGVDLYREIDVEVDWGGQIPGFSKDHGWPWINCPQTHVRDQHRRRRRSS